MLSNGFTFKPSPYHALNDFKSFYSNYCRDVDLKEAGTLNKEIAKQDQGTITRLKIKGDINGTDIITINRMTALKALDLSEANIVEGGYSYKESLFTENDVVGSQFFSDIALERLALPESANYIDKNALSNLTSLKFVGIGANTNTIDNYAFSRCTNLKKIVLPESVKTIGLNVFNGCNGIKEVYSLNPVPREINGSVFDEYVYSNSTLHVKEGSKSLYAVAPVWEQFSNIEEDSEDQNVTSNTIEIIDSTDNNADISSDPDSYIEVYTLNGMLIYKGSHKEAQLEKGIYIVRQGNVAVKINVQ